LEEEIEADNNKLEIICDYKPEQGKWLNENVNYTRSEFEWNF